jgi:alpha-L-rhamnosidase
MARKRAFTAFFSTPGILLGLASILTWSATAQSRRAPAAISPVRLRAGSLVSPVGLDAKRPEFSWTLKAADTHAHNLSQSAYRIVVSSTRERLKAPDVWDSGRMTSTGFLHVIYDGSALHPHTTYYWRLRVWDQNGVGSPWSATAHWTTALLDPSDWRAKWIAAEPDGPARTQPRESDEHPLDSPKPMPIFRRDFSVGKRVKQALVFVTGLGQYELTLNGNAVTDTVLNPGWTAYPKTVLYQTYDVTSLLGHGGNCFAVMLGGGMYHIPNVKDRYAKFVGSVGEPKLILQMHLLYIDGTTETIVSDHNWTTASGPIVFSSTYGGEDFDARQEVRGWKTAGFDDRSWADAVEVAGPDGMQSPPGSQLSGNIIPPIRIVRTRKPSKVTRPAPGIAVYDFGENFSGWPRIAVRGRRGDVIKLLAGELLDTHGFVTQQSAHARPDNPVLFTYILKGGGSTEIWHPRFTYYGFRYVQVQTEAISSIPTEKPTLRSMESDIVHDDVEHTGQFSSSLPLFNRIHRLIDNAILSNMVSVLTDCPTREKLGWLEQTHLMGTSIMENYDVVQLYRKVDDDMADAQLPDGLVPSIAPEVVAFVDREGQSTVFRDSPEWGSAIILSPWAAYQFYGDRRLLAEHYVAMTRYAAYLRGKSDDHILLFGLGDWYDLGPKEPGPSQLTGQGLTATAIYYQDLLAMVQTAQLLGHQQDAMAYAQEAEAVKEAFNRHFFHPEVNRYDRGSQTANAMPLVLGLVPEGDRPAVLEQLIADIRKQANHVTAGDIGFHYVVRALTDEGRSDVLFDMLSRTDSPSYGYQLAKGATTLTEAWDANPKDSQDHFMLGDAEEWFYRGLAGIDLDLARPGGQQIILRPALLKEVHGASATVQSVLGVIRVSWVYHDVWSLDVEIPPGASATVYLPGPSRGITEGSRPLAGASFRLGPVEADGRTALVLGSGAYHFRGASPIN